MKWRKFTKGAPQLGKDFIIREIHREETWPSAVAVFNAYRTHGGGVRVCCYHESIQVDVSVYEWLDEGRKPKAKGRKRK